MRLPPTATALVATLSVLLPVIADSLPAFTLDGVECKSDWPSESGNYKGPPPGYTGLIPNPLRRRDDGTPVDLRSLVDCSRIGDERGREKCEAYLEARNNTTTLVKKSPQIPEMEGSAGPCCIITFECKVFFNTHEPEKYTDEEHAKALCCVADYLDTCGAETEDIPAETYPCYPPLCSNPGNTCKDEVPVEAWRDLGLTWVETEG